MFVSYILRLNRSKLNFGLFVSMARPLIVAGETKRLEELFASIKKSSVLNVNLQSRKKAFQSLPPGDLSKKFFELLQIKQC